jgi:hypothetical protein
LDIQSSGAEGAGPVIRGNPPRNFGALDTINQHEPFPFGPAPQRQYAEG